MRKFFVIILGLAACSSGQVGVPDAGALPDVLEPDEGEPKIGSDGLAVVAVEPDHGPFTGGNWVTVRGTLLPQSAVVRFDGVPVEPLWVVWLDPTRILIQGVPAGEAGPADVTVEEVDGTGAVVESTTLAGGYVYDSFWLDPNSGTTAGGTFVTITGQNTAFDASSAVTIGDSALEDVVVLSPTILTGSTPPGPEGPADVAISTAVADIEVRDGFSYFPGVSLGLGGLGGGDIEESLQVTVVDYQSGAPVAGAFVIVDADETTLHQGLADGAGQIVFTGAFTTPLSVTAGAMDYETTTIVSFNAREAVIRLIYLPPPTPGPPPPGILGSHVEGVIQFGGPSGIGTEVWTHVPEPATSTQYKCAHVRASIPSLYGPQPSPGSGALVPYEAGQTSWPFYIFTRPGAMAVYALAGICDSATIPEGFTAYAMGVTRGVLAGPGETVQADIVVDIALDQAMDVTLEGAPPLAIDYFGFRPNRHFLAIGIDLGGDGILLRWDTIVFPSGDPLQVVIPGQAALVGSALWDASYILVAGAESFGSGPLSWPEAVDVNQDGATFYIPFTAAIKKGVIDISAPITVDGFVGIPVYTDPTPYGTIVNRHLEWSHVGAAAPALSMLTLMEPGALGDIPVWRMFVEGSTTTADLPDLTATAGLPDMPSTLNWTTWNVSPPAEGYDFDTFTYRDALGFQYFEAFAIDRYQVNYVP